MAQIRWLPFSAIGHEDKDILLFYNVTIIPDTSKEVYERQRCCRLPRYSYRYRSQNLVLSARLFVASATTIIGIGGPCAFIPLSESFYVTSNVQQSHLIYFVCMVWRLRRRKRHHDFSFSGMVSRRVMRTYGTKNGASSFGKSSK